MPTPRLEGANQLETNAAIGTFDARKTRSVNCRVPEHCSGPRHNSPTTKTVFISQDDALSRLARAIGYVAGREVEVHSEYHSRVWCGLPCRLPRIDEKWSVVAAGGAVDVVPKTACCPSAAGNPVPRPPLVAFVFRPTPLPCA